MHEWQSLSHVGWGRKYRVVFYFQVSKAPAGLPVEPGPFGGAFLKPRPMGVVDYSGGDDDGYASVQTGVLHGRADPVERGFRGLAVSGSEVRGGRRAPFRRPARDLVPEQRRRARRAGRPCRRPRERRGSRGCARRLAITPLVSAFSSLLVRV